MISNKTKRNIFDHFNMENILFSGRMSDIDFLKRIYNLEDMPSHDSRYENALGDIWQHTENNYDYEGNWVFDDNRFNLLSGTNESFLRFLCEMAHPLVRPDHHEANRIQNIANDWLLTDGWELFPTREIAGGKILGYRQVNAVKKPTEEEVHHIWDTDKLRFFISHRDAHKVEAKKLGADLDEYGISCFVAHDSIQPMSTWKHEIMKALQTMEACICYITDDFYMSEWTNQEVGFALAKGIPIYLYSVDKTDPKGFKLDTQAIKSGVPALINCIKKDFISNPKFKMIFLKKFIDAKDGTWDNAKNMFYELLGLKFKDSEIEDIIQAFNSKAKFSNQLTAVLNDKIKPEHAEHPCLKSYSYYREYLDNNILKHHSTKKYSFEQNGSTFLRIIETEK